jgi:hypothetical protein
MSIHKIIVHPNGTKVHTPSNSWEEAAKIAKWPSYAMYRFLDWTDEGLGEQEQYREQEHLNYVECQWNTEDPFPNFAEYSNITIDDFKQIASHEGPWTEKAVKTIVEHYSKLNQLLSDPKTHAEQMLFNNGYFAGEEYADIRWDMMYHANTPKSVIEKLAHTTLYANSKKAIKSLHPAIKKIQGDFIIDKEVKINAQNLEEISETVWLLENASLTTPNLKEVKNIILLDNVSLTAPNLEKAESISLGKNANLTAPNLEKAESISLGKNASLTDPNIEKTEHISLDENTSLTAPNLKKAGLIQLDKNASLTAPNLKKAKHISLTENTSLTAPNLEEVEIIILTKNTSLTAPNLKKAEYIRLDENTSLTAPNLKKVERIWLEENTSLTIPDPGEVDIIYATRDKNNNSMKYNKFKSLNEIEPKFPSPADNIVSEEPKDPEPETPEPETPEPTMGI